MIRALTLVLALAIGYVGFEAFRFMAAGPGSPSESVVFEIPSGMTFRQVAEELEQKKLILSSFKMRIYAKLTAQGHRIRRGEYALNRGMTPQQILSIFVAGKSIQYPVTFPEGSNIFEMAKILEQKGLFKTDEFLAAVKDKALIRELLGIEVSSLEGYLFPETYNLTKYTSIRELLASMVGNLKQAYAQTEALHKGTAPQLSRHEIVTLASIVEKETGAPSERPMIASVFFNRLKKGMKLQSDPTIIYGIWVDTGRYKQNITKSDIATYNRYNTYTVPKLPFGPIANPGREAIEAVFNPAISDYYFFVSRNDGTHIFTRSYQEHSAAVKSFQLDPSAREGKSWRDLKKQPTSAVN